MKRRMKQGRDWHGWAFKAADADTKGFMFWAEHSKPNNRPTEKGKWVRVKFVEIK